MNKFKKTIKSFGYTLGFDLRRLTPASSESFQTVKAINRFEIDLVLDVGANIGQFASELRSFGYQGKLISFEPLSVAHQALSAAASRDSQWQVHPRCAVGDHDGEIEINVANNSVSSSVLPMTELHSSAAKDSVYIEVEKVPIFKLDSIASAYIEKAKFSFLKIDTQGFEWQVLDGASEILPRVKGVLCELSLVPLYEGQRLWLDMMQRLEKEGFTLWAIQQGFVDPRDARTLQVDAIFFRV